MLLGEKLGRSEMFLDSMAVVAFLRELAERISGAELLRIYWYDGTSGNPTPQQMNISYCDNVKLRLGFVNLVGQQKGVDSLIVTDMITLARNLAMSDAVLLSGDEDLRVGVQLAQEYGVRVHLLGIPTSQNNQSTYLQREADMRHLISEDDLKKFLTRTVRREVGDEFCVQPSDSEAPSAQDTVGCSAEYVAAGLLADESETMTRLLQQDAKWVPLPGNIDSRLLNETSRRLGRDLTTEEKKDVRKLFLEACRKHAAH